MSTTEASAQPAPPRASSNAIDWARRNLFNGWFNSIITVVLSVAIVAAIVPLFNWVFNEATWAPVPANLRLLMVGRYTADQVWRIQAVVSLILLLFAISGGIWGGILRGLASGLVAAVILLALIPIGFDTQLWLAGVALLMGLSYVAGLRLSRSLRWPVIALWVASPFLVVTLVRGIEGVAFLPVVNTNLWGGLLLTMMLAVVGIVASFPLGVLLALGRRSNLPVIKGFCIVYIETIRGVPLVTVLFVGALLLPLFLPANLRVDAIVRAMIAITLFSAAYLAENVRGGLQAVPNGQVEAARSLGLNVFQSTLLIVLPQALRAVIPVIVGQFIALFKDTSLVAIIGITELLGMAGVVISQPDWLSVTGGVQREVLLFVALVYWVFCFVMSQVSRRIETNLGIGTR